MKFSLQQLYARAAQRPAGYIQAVLAKATVTGNSVELNEADYAELKTTYRNASKSDPMVEPSIVELAQNFSIATTRWAAEGFPVVSEAVYAQRSAVCEECRFWDGAARLGLGKCKAPGCGCTRFKRWLATERCPEKLWPE